MIKILDIYKNPLYILYQWDINQFVNIIGINPEMPVSVQFWRAGQSEAFVVESTVSGNTVTAAIPNELLREPGELVIYIWQDTGSGEQKGGRTETFFNVPIKERAQPSDYIYDDNVEYISVKTVIEDAKAATTAAQEATEAATSAAKLANDTADEINQRADSGEFDGAQGEQGPQGEAGPQGEKGTDGKSATITIGTVTTVPPDTPASVTNSGTETDAVFDFEIPKGQDGSGGGTDIETLEKIAIKTTIEGNPAMSGSSAEWRVPLIEGYGQSTQGADPTPEAPQEIKSSAVTGVKVIGKNLFDMSNNFTLNLEKGTIDVGLIDVKDNKLIINFLNTQGYAHGAKFYCLKNKEMVFMCHAKYPPGARVQVSIYDEIGSTLNIKIFSEEDIKLQFQTQKNYVFIGFQSITQTGVELSELSLKESVNTDAYEPYKEQSIPLSVPIALRGIPSESGNVTIDGQKYLSDYIGQKEGVYGVFRKLREENLTGIENWIKGTEKNLTVGFVLNGDYTYETNGFCDKLIWYRNGVQNDYELIAVANQLFVRVKKERLTDTTAQSFKNWLAENPLHIVTVATAETFEPLPEADQQALKDLKTFYPTSIISWETEDNSGAWARAEIIHDPTNYINYIDEKLGQITAQQTALQAEILKIGGNI